jgi:hypothetical protein
MVVNKHEDTVATAKPSTSSCQEAAQQVSSSYWTIAAASLNNVAAIAIRHGTNANGGEDIPVAPNGHFGDGGVLPVMSNSLMLLLMMMMLL